MSLLEKLANFVLNNRLSKAVGKAVEYTADWITTPSHVRAMREAGLVVQAARAGDIEKVKKALKKESRIDYANAPFIKMLLSEAAEHGQKEIVQLLLDRGASPVGEDRGLEHAEAALIGGHVSIVELLYKSANDKGVPTTEKLKNAFSRAQEVRAKELQKHPAMDKSKRQEPRQR